MWRRRRRRPAAVGPGAARAEALCCRRAGRPSKQPPWGRGPRAPRRFAAVGQDVRQNNRRGAGGRAPGCAAPRGECEPHSAACAAPAMAAGRGGGGGGAEGAGRGKRTNGPPPAPARAGDGKKGRARRGRAADAPAGAAPPGRAAADRGLHHNNGRSLVRGGARRPREPAPPRGCALPPPAPRPSRLQPARQCTAEAGRMTRSSAEPRIGAGSAVRGDVELGEGARIGRCCVVEGKVRIGARTRIDDHCVVRGRVTIGEDNWIYPFCTVGTGPQHSEYPEDPGADPSADPGAGEIVMGSGNTMRGYASINLPTVSGRTSVGSGCHLLAYSHVAHDCDVRDGAILSAGAILGGHTEVGAGAHLGLGTMVHPHTRIGRLAMVGLRGAVVRDVPPFALINAGRFTRVNAVGMERAGMPAAEVSEVERAYAEVAAAGGGGAKGGGGPGPPSGAGALAREIREFLAGTARGCYPPRF